VVARNFIVVVSPGPSTRRAECGSPRSPWPMISRIALLRFLLKARYQRTRQRLRFTVRAKNLSQVLGSGF